MLDVRLELTVRHRHPCSQRAFAVVYREFVDGERRVRSCAILECLKVSLQKSHWDEEVAVVVVAKGGNEVNVLERIDGGEDEMQVSKLGESGVQYRKDD